MAIGERTTSGYTVKFCDRKIAKVRWLEAEPICFDGEQKSFFVAASGDHRPHNNLSLWSLSHRDQQDDSSDPGRTLVSIDYGGEVDAAPADVEYLDLDYSPARRLLAAGGSDGIIRVYDMSLSLDDQEPGPHFLQEIKAHGGSGSKPASCSGVAIHPIAAQPEYASVGSDGYVVLSSGYGSKLLSIMNPDTSHTTAIKWRNANEFVTCGISGTVSVFDRRLAKRAQSFRSNMDAVALNCLAVHSDCIAAGGENGTIQFWDVRNTPACDIISPHSDNVWEIHFNSRNTSEVLSCSEDATVVLSRCPFKDTGYFDVPSRTNVSRKIQNFYQQQSVNSASLDGLGVLLCGGDSMSLSATALRDSAAFSFVN
ncbi:WD40-repeat-containing domain protein [Polychytrium aggregatum]|uniref:WD40-repeat-containing domain protein n=1 Tax=Polychytrium aggregatum TaxID=110093 RepID=UPI0022FF1DEF|nr:WD40-repeat-containing domain protein [Polychytrium aggregatum]KAI9209696.1 WD40-repeat-containing domain protein [Polychytrium aggregatum]